MYEKIKKFFNFIIKCLAAVALFLIGRRCFDRSGVQHIDEELRRSEYTAKRAEDKNNELGKRLDESARRTEELGKRLDECKEGTAGIKQDNQGIEERLEESINILRKAKERSQKG